MAIDFGIGFHDAPFYLRALQWGREKMTPRAEFLSPQQGAGGDDNPPVSWWHIAIRVQRGWLYFPEELPDCEIELCIYDLAEDHNNDIFPMRWQTADDKKGKSARTLRVGKTYKVPVVYRREGSGTFLSDRHFLERDGKCTKLQAGQYVLHIGIKSGPREFLSENPYFLNVPPEDKNNGLFYLEQRYPDQMPKRKRNY